MKLNGGENREINQDKELNSSFVSFNPCAAGTGNVYGFKHVSDLSNYH